MMPTAEERIMLAKRALAGATPSMREIAADMGVAYATVRAWNAGVRAPTMEHLVKLADTLERRGDHLRELAAELRRAAGE